jgi:hypothetical protein
MPLPESDYEINAIHLTTEKRSSGDISNPSWILDTNILGADAIKVKRATIPNSFYTIDTRNNKLYLKNGTAASVALTLTSGYFNDITLQSNLSTNLTGGYSVSLNTVGNFFSVSHTANSFSFTTGDNSANYELGINNQTNATQQNFEQMDLSGVKNIIIASNISTVDIIGDSKKILANIPCEVAAKGILQFSDDSEDYIPLNSENLNEITLRLYDERLRPLTVSKDWSATLNILTK